MKSGSKTSSLFRATSSLGLEISRTYPNFVDLNDDGYLDPIYGEPNGYFIKFDVTAAKGTYHFSDQAEILKDQHGDFLNIYNTSTPHFLD